MLKLTTKAVDKVMELLAQQGDLLNIEGLRIGVTGGGCSGFQYNMGFAKKGSIGLLDKVFVVEGSGITGKKSELKVIADQASLLYLENCEIDYVEALEGAGFKFNNPNVKSTCGCGSSFQA